jgi:hypothetical protein
MNCGCKLYIVAVTYVMHGADAINTQVKLWNTDATNGLPGFQKLSELTAQVSTPQCSTTGSGCPCYNGTVSLKVCCNSSPCARHVHLCMPQRLTYQARSSTHHKSHATPKPAKNQEATAGPRAATPGSDSTPLCQCSTCTFPAAHACSNDTPLTPSLPSPQHRSRPPCLPPQPTSSPADNYADGQGEITAYTQLRYSGQVTNFPRGPSGGSSACQILATVSQTGGSNAQLAIVQADAYKLNTIDVSRNGPRSCPASLRGSSGSSSDYRWALAWHITPQHITGHHSTSQVTTAHHRSPQHTSS